MNVSPCQFSTNILYMKIVTKKMFGLLALLMVGAISFAQTVLWGGAGDPNGEFANGLNDWTVASNDPDALWVWDADGAAGLGAYSGGGTPIQSASVANGAAVFDSDYYDNGGVAGNFGNGVAAAPQIGELISPIIDVTGYSYIAVNFTQRFRQFDSECLIAYSNDGGTTWMDTVLINDKVLTNDEADKTKLSVPLPGGGNTSNFRFKFIFDANYYFWVIDDVSIIERPEFDLMIGDFFYSPSSYAQPISQIKTDTMGFIVDFKNIGRSAQDDVVLKVEIAKGNEIVYTDEFNLGTLIADSPDSTFFFENTFVPDMLSTGTYRLKYSISSANPDFDMTNNSYQQNFRVTSDFYAKEDESSSNERAFGGSDETHYVGNAFITGKDWVEQYQATTAEVQCRADQGDPIGGKVLTLYLLSVNDDVAPNWDGFEQMTTEVVLHPNLTWVGYGEHTFPTVYGNGNDIVIPLADSEELNPGVLLTPGTRYLLMVEYSGEASTISQYFNTKIDYVLQISTVAVDGNRWYLGGYGSRFSATIRMNISLYSSTDDVALPDNSLTFYPNPANSELTVDLDLEEPTLANVTLADLNGRVIEIDEIENAYKQTRKYDVSNLPNGTYIVRIATKAGTKTKKFVVQH